MPKYKLHVNDAVKEVESESDTPLLYILRNNLELNGPKFGCGIAQCGACMVLLDGRSVMSCSISVSSVGESKITTLEGLQENNELHPVQKAFINEQAAQCGYCVNGIIMSAVGLLNQNPSPDESEIRSALQPNLCRCSAHTRMLKAIKRVIK